MPRARRSTRPRAATVAAVEAVVAAPPPPPSPPPGPPEGYVLCGRVYMAPWDIPTRGPGLWDLPFGPAEAKARQTGVTCHHHMSSSYRGAVYGCVSCEKFANFKELYRRFARYPHSRCADANCFVCLGTLSPDDTDGVNISDLHLRWENFDRDTLRCKTCDQMFDECDCIVCRQPGCSKLYLSSEQCQNCGSHIGCVSRICRCRDCVHPTGQHRIGRNVATCPDCNTCVRHCTHPRCHTCRVILPENVGQRNPDCQHACNGCRACDPCARQFMPYIHQTRTTMHKLDLTVPNIATKFKEVPVKRLMGVEVEAFARRWNQVGLVMENWGGGIVTDGSIQPTIRDGRHKGFEVNTAPAMGVKFHDQLMSLGDALTKSEAKVNTSCGVHVHVDASSYRWWDVQRLIRLYKRVEGVLYGVCAPYRSWSHYAQKCGAHFYEGYVQGIKGPKDLKKKMMGGFYNVTDQRIRLAKQQDENIGQMVQDHYNQKYNSMRYYALNLHSWFLRGTIEFRHHHGTVNAENIRNWAVVCGTVIEKAEKMSDADVDGILYPASWLMNELPTHVADWFVARQRYMTGMETRSADEQDEYICRYCVDEYDEQREYHSRECDDAHGDS